MKHMKSLLASFMAISLLCSGQTQPQTTDALPMVKVVATDGTIANPTVGRMAVDVLLELISEVRNIANIEIYDYNRIGKSEVTIQNWIDIAHVITNEFNNNPDIAGIVVTHGSNTSEESAYFLNLLLDTDRPVVVAGAQRQRTMLSEDGSRNFYDAVRVAVHPDAGGPDALC